VEEVLMASYRFYCTNDYHVVVKWTTMSLPSDGDAFAHAANLLLEGYSAVEIIDGVRILGAIPPRNAVFGAARRPIHPGRVLEAAPPGR
jgi:hypothetical protein